MAPNSPPRDPRKRPDPSLAGQQRDESRKRHASQSPVGPEKPYKKLVKPGNSSLHRSSSIVNGNGSGAVAGANHDATTATSATAPTETKSSSRAEILDLLMTFGQQSAEVGSLQITHDQAKQQAEKASTTYSALGRYFESFPATREQATNSKTRTEEKRLVEQQKLSNARSDQEKTAHRLADLLSSARLNQMFSSLSAVLESQRAILDRLSEVERTVSSLQDISNATESQPATVALSDPSIDLRVQKLEEDVKVLEDNQAGAQDEISSAVGAEIDTIKTWVDEETQKLRDSFNNNKDVQHQNAQTINDFMVQLETLKADVRLVSAREDIVEINHKLSSLSEAVQKIRDRASTEHSTNPLGLEEFKPMPSFSSEPAEAHLGLIQRMQSEILALQGITRLHTQQYDNLTTDHVVKQMADQMSMMYPDAKNFQLAVNSMNTRIAGTSDEVAAKFGAISGRVNTLEANSGNQDAEKVRTDVTDLKQKFEMHEDALARGQQVFEHAETDIKAIKLEIHRLDGKVDRMLKKMTEGQ